MNNTSVLKNPISLKSVNNRFMFVHCLLISVHSLILIGFVFYQFIQPLFLNSSTWIFTYCILFLSLSIDVCYVYFYEKIKKHVYFQWLFLTLDSLLMTICLSISYFILSPVLIFIYMIHIFSAGLLGQYKGAFAQGLLVSFLFSWLLILHPSGINADSSLVLSFVLNNIGFMTVAGLSGFLGKQASQMKWSLIEADKVVNHLENLNEFIVDNMNMGFFILDKQALIVHSNKKAHHLLNISVLDSTPLEKIFPQLSAHILSHEYKNTNCFKSTYTQNTEPQLIEFFISNIKQSHTGDQKYLILFQDYTQKQKMENTIQEKERLASIGKMAAGIAHEIRNPLSSIGGSIQLLDIDSKKTSENKKLMNIALEEINRLNKIIGDFLDYAKDENESSYKQLNKMQPLNVNPILEDLLESIRVNPKWKHISHNFILKSQEIVLGNSDKFKQIFLNIIKNSCEAMENQKVGSCLSIESFDKEGWVVVNIKDTGIGINSEDSFYIYDPFFSKKIKGTGLGLSIVRKLVTLYKGEISYNQNADSKGTICTLMFPIEPNAYPEEMVQNKSA